MALDTKSAFSTANFQRATAHILQKRKISQGRACESESLKRSKTKKYLTSIPRARMGYESIAHEAEGRMGY